MANRLKCNSCGATYPDTTPPGSVSYFHACPDEILVTSDVLDAANKVILPATFRPMPNPRNETLIPDPAKLGNYVMKEAGSGVTKV